MRTLAIFHAVLAGWSARGMCIAIADEQSAVAAIAVSLAFAVNLAVAVVRVREARP